MSKLKDRDYRKIFEVIKNFNFKQCCEVLKFVHDKYGKSKFNPNEPDPVPFTVCCENVPTPDQLEDTAWEILKSVISEDLKFCSSGWLRAEKIEYTDYPNDYELGLYFDLINYTEEPEEPKENKQ